MRRAETSRVKETTDVKVVALVLARARPDLRMSKWLKTCGADAVGGGGVCPETGLGVRR